ncbi:hypothetical protein BAY59_26380 [Prauserella coralliicola]|nr:hypothetical protein BAY59_26380 [Prauserella coralliicola]
MTEPIDVELDRVGRWLRQAGLGAGPIESATVLGGGTQNLLLVLCWGGRDLVLRCPPRHSGQRGDETMRREARVLTALGRTDVPHARLVAHCGDPAVIGAAFTLTERVAGFNAGVEIPETVLADETAQHRLGLTVVDALLALGRVTPRRVGLADLGRPDGWLERQPDRWRRQLAGYHGTGGYRDGSLPGAEEIARWLAEHRPPTWRPGLVHGDFHLANVLADPSSGAVRAVIDWELCTQGDPLLDLGHLLATWPQDNDPRVRAPLAAALPGLPSRRQLLDHYARHSDRDLDDLRWFEVLARYRLAVIVEGTHVRALVGQVLPAIGREAHARAVGLLERAMTDIETNGW